MKRHWEVDELIEHWTLLPSEEALLENKIGANRLGFAVLLKFFQLEGRFPSEKSDVPKPVIVYLAKQLSISWEEYHAYDWQGRSIKYHRAQIRSFLDFREATASDETEMINWLVEQVLAHEQDIEHLSALVFQQFRSIHIEPPTNQQTLRLIRSAIRKYETNFFSNTLQKLSDLTKTQIDALLSQTTTTDSEENINPQDSQQSCDFSDLKADPGRVGLESIFTEVAKLQCLQQLELPLNLFSSVSPKVLEIYKLRVAAELPSQLRAHPEAIRYTLMSAFCYKRSQEITDSLIELLLQIVHRLSARAETKIEKELLQDFKRVSGKTGLLYQLAEVSLANPDGIVKDVVYPVVGQQTLIDLVKEFKSTGNAYRQKVYKVMRSSYSSYYRRMVPKILDVLEFRSNNDVHRPVIQALELIKKYADSNQRYYDASEEIPTDGILRSSLREIILEKDVHGHERINRINYEISVLQALREQLRCKEIWVVGANRYRNPEEDLPADFDSLRETYYQALNKPTDVDVFINSLQQAMHEALSSLDKNIPHNPKVKILQKGKGWISVSPLEAQTESTFISRLKAEIGLRWSTTSLLDILKEADLRIGFTEHFKTVASRETLDRTTLQKRLLLCLYGLGTNTGLKRLSAAAPDSNYQDLRYVQRRFINKNQLRKAIAEIVNAIFQVRLPQIWGEATTTCASDSKKFGAWDQNLMTEWHIRYGGRGVMIYWHVERKSTCIYSQLKTCSSSEVAAIIEGVLRHCTNMKVEKNFVDSHGQSEVAFAFCHLLGFELLPRLKRIHSQKLYRPEAGNSSAYPNLQLILTRPIKWDLIRQQYDQMVKYTTALRLGTAEPEAILKRFTRANVQHPTYQALCELGKAVKTIFLCQYLQSEALRREINEGLNVIENWNSANSFIFYGKGGEIATNRLEEQELSVLSLHLLQICLVYINTLMIQQVLREPSWMSKMKKEDFRALTPLFYSHVNPYGTFRLDLEERLRIDHESLEVTA
ncbi:MAG: Tn3 family transposase [Hapalosiphonaceae cyanobacterium JJU2]|nr:MAG: Tn3 family transposase [Hapalosiphonaceae cyanobacterium JJU2]